MQYSGWCRGHICNNVNVNGSLKKKVVLAMCLACSIKNNIGELIFIVQHTDLFVCLDDLRFAQAVDLLAVFQRLQRSGLSY